MKFNGIFFSTVCCLAALASPAHAGSPADTAWSYQGRLFDQAEPANGSYSMEFSLWDAETGGTQIGSTVVLNTVDVTDGLFIAQLDFGADPFDVTNRWLAVTVDGVPLAPRQIISRVPYSIQTRGMTIGDNGNVSFSSLTSAEGTVEFSSPGGIDMILNADTNNSGEDQNARIVMKQDGGQVVGRVGYREGNNQLEIMQEWSDNLVLGTSNLDRMWIRPNGFVGIGRPDQMTAFERFGVHSDATSGFAGMYVSTAGEDGAPFYGYSTGGDVDAYHYYNGVTGKWHFVNGTGIHMTVDAEGDVGIGTTDPLVPLHVVADGPGYAIRVSSTNGSAGIFSETNDFVGIGVWGQATGASAVGIFGQGYDSQTGVSGSTGSGRAIIARANDKTGTNYAFWAKCNSPDGYDFYANGAGMNYGSSSSIRWKHNIENIAQPLDMLAQLRGVYFDWDKEHGGQHDVGMIAEEVGKVLPEIVGYEENGVDAIGMDYSKLTPLLVEAVNALRVEKDAEITALQRQVDELKALVAELVVERDGSSIRR